jgi:hypothetical protein
MQLVDLFEYMMMHGLTKLKSDIMVQALRIPFLP